MEPNYNFLNEGPTSSQCLNELYSSINIPATRMICNNGQLGRESFWENVKRFIQLRWMEIKYFVKHGKKIQ